MSVCITGILSLILSSAPQMSKSASFTQASKALPFLPYDFSSQGGSVFPFKSQPNRLWWHLSVLHESTTFRRAKICMLCTTSHDMKWERTQTWHHSSPHKRKGCLCTILLNYVLSVLKAMSNVSSYKSSQCEPSTQWRKNKEIHIDAIWQINSSFDIVHCQFLGKDLRFFNDTGMDFHRLWGNTVGWM